MKSPSYNRCSKCGKIITDKKKPHKCARPKPSKYMSISNVRNNEDDDDILDIITSDEDDGSDEEGDDSDDE